MTGISGRIPDELYAKLKNSPLRGGKTLAEYYKEIFQEHVESPEYQFAEWKKEQVAQFEREKRDLQWRRDEMQDSYNQMQERNRMLERDLSAAEHVDSPKTAATPTSETEYLDEHVEAVLVNVRALDIPGKVELILLANGESAPFTDRVTDLPENPRATFIKSAFGVPAANSIANSLPQLIGHRVRVQRIRKQKPDGSWEMKKYYRPLPRAA